MRQNDRFSDMCKGIKDLVAEEKDKSRKEAEEAFAQLIRELKNDNQMSELDRVLSDVNYREQLYRKYDIN